MIFVADNHSAEVEEPGKEPFDLPASDVASQRPSVLGGDFAVALVGGDHLRAVVIEELFIQPVAVVGLVPNQAFGHVRYEAFFQGFFNQFHFSWRSAFCPQGERKTRAVCNAHDLGALAPLGFSHLSPPFLAGTNVPSTKHSFKSNPPASWRCLARAKSSCSITPERTQFWKRRWAVWCGPYRSGRSFHGAPVRKIHNMPFSTVRRSLHGRPRPSSRTGSSGRMFLITSHCSLVNSIHNHLHTND